jgi:hypothetical protein
MKSKVIGPYILDQVLSILAAGVALFWSAGRLNWWPAWAALAIWLAAFAAMDFLLMRFNPELMAERLAPPKGAKKWDRAILNILRLTQLAPYISQANLAGDCFAGTCGRCKRREERSSQ